METRNPSGTRTCGALACVFVFAIVPQDASGQAAGGTETEVAAPSSDLSGSDGREIYVAACANCHGTDGTGAPAHHVAFDIPLPDFSDCSFASREPDADWVAVAHEGGPVRGFDRMMPAFGDALTMDQLQRVMDYIRTLCGDDDWPRGELNLPRPMVTEKAYPEDEAVWTSGVRLSGPGTVSNEFVWEQRFGSRNQIEVVIPFSFRERPDATADATGWVSGLADVVVGVKRTVFHSLPAGTILAVAAEMKLPTGDENDGLGSGTPVFESFVSFGQVLPADFFLHAQGVVELPFDTDRAENEGAMRLALGRSFQEGAFGRVWSPMLEVLTSRPLAAPATTHWDLLPQMQVTLNTRQHVMLNAGVRFPLNDFDSREPQLLVYVLWDWFDGGFTEGW